MRQATGIILLVMASLALLSAGWYYSTQQTAGAGGGAAAAHVAGVRPLRLGLIPEQNVFEMRRRYRVLGDYLAQKLGRPVEFATVNSYRAVLDDFKDQDIDAAFLGSLVAVLAQDRLGAQVVVKTIDSGGSATYTGVVFVRDDSPVREIDDLAGRSIGLVRTTTGGNLFPIEVMLEHHLLDRPTPPELVWCGGHDEVIMDVADGHLGAGAVKNLRLDEYVRAHPQVKFRRLAESGAVPNNALVVRGDLAGTLGPVLREALLDMAQDPAGQKALAAFGARGFAPCGPEEYRVIYDLVQRLGPEWSRLEVDGPPPRRFGAAATSQPSARAVSTAPAAPVP